MDEAIQKTDRESEAVELYRTAFVLAREDGESLDAAKAYARAALYEKFPYLRSKAHAYPMLWSRIAQVVVANGGRRPGKPKKAESDGMRKNSDTVMGTVRKLAATGFIPDGKHLVMFLPMKSSHYIDACVQRLKTEGVFEVARNEHGWTAKRAKTTDELIAEHTEKMVAALKANDTKTAFAEFTEINILTGKS